MQASGNGFMKGKCVKCKAIIARHPLKANALASALLLALLAAPFLISGAPNWVAPLSVKSHKGPEEAHYGEKDPGVPGASNALDRTPPRLLTDGTAEPYGSAETDDDTFVYIRRPAPFAAHEVDVVPFSPQGNQHMRDVAVIAALQKDGKSRDIAWMTVPARMKGQSAYTDKITIPPYDDNTLVRLELDPAFLQSRTFDTYGIAVFSASKGFRRNYLRKGRGVYIREMALH
jgi:hypothetical protein